MQSLQMRCPVAATSGLSMQITASAPIAYPCAFSIWNSEILSSSGHPASVTPKALFRYASFAGAAGSGFSGRPCEQESLPCAWHQMQ